MTVDKSMKAMATRANDNLADSADELSVASVTGPSAISMSCLIAEV